MMKTFKFGLVGLLVGLIGLFNFGTCDNYTYFGNAEVLYTIPANGTGYFSSSCYTKTNIKFGLSFYNFNGDLILNGSDLPNSFNFVCFDTDGYVYNSSNEDLSIYGYSTGIVYLPYVSNNIEVDTNYCVENDLCPVPENFSQLFINEIEHQSYPVINVSIPDEFSWDYTGNNGSFDLNIIGYNVDTEYIEGIINTQNSKPNNQDFNNIITGVLPLLIPGFVIIMFIYFIFRLIKKIF